MQLTQAALQMEAAVEAQLRLTDPELAGVGSDLLEVLRPAIKQTLMDVVEMAAQEVNGQLSGQRVDIRLVEGDPELTVRHDEPRIPTPPTPPSPGDSVNSFVVDALRSRAYERVASQSVRKTLDL